MIALCRRVYIGGPVQRQHRHMVHAAGGRVVAKMNVPGQIVLDRLQEQAGPIAQGAAGQSEARANERPSPDSHQCDSTRCGSMPSVCSRMRAVHMNMTEAGAVAPGAVGSRHSSSSNPFRCSCMSGGSFMGASLPTGLEHCWHRHRMLYTRT